MVTFGSRSLEDVELTGRRLSALAAAMFVVAAYPFLVTALNAPEGARGAIGDRTTTTSVAAPTTTTSAPVSLIPGPLAAPRAGTYDVQITSATARVPGQLLVSADGSQRLSFGDQVRSSRLRWTHSQGEVLEAGSCEWSPKVVEIAPNLAPGKQWSNSSSCVATTTQGAMTIQRQESAAVRESVRVPINGTPINTWRITRRIITTQRVAGQTRVVDEATTELFAPSLGLAVYRASQVNITNPDGTITSTVESVELVTTVPR